jgi:hypothetical protein
MGNMFYLTIILYEIKGYLQFVLTSLLFIYLFIDNYE